MKKLSVFFIVFLLSFGASGQKLEKRWSTSQGFETPESVLYDPEMEMVYVANMGTERDQNTSDGFLSLLDLNGQIENIKWITGLHEPKGMAVYDERLYVADINELVVIDLNSASLFKKYPAPDAIFLNDVCVSENGTVFVSDSRDQRIYALINNELVSWLHLPELENVNGLWSEKGKLYAGNASIWEIDIESKEMNERLGGAGGVDGLEKIDDRSFLFSNWAGRIYLSQGQEIIQLLDSTEEKINTADIDYLPRQKRVLVPTFFGNSVDCYQLIPD
ncbi:MAG TPA: hypothetical protein PLK12_03205 [Prolixibacteraceae bacterium]|nr:hypothetical protein [Prolixibacteraceae bacterium]